MADILVRKISDEVKERLAKAAARAGFSLEAHARRILEASAAETPRPNDEVLPFSVLARQLFADGSGEELADIIDSLEYAPEPLADFSDA